MLITFEVFQLDISGNDISELQPSNKLFIFSTFEVFHLDKSGNDDNRLHFEKIPHIFLTLEVSNFDIPGKDNNEQHSQNIKPILVMLLIPFRINEKESSLLYLRLISSKYSLRSYSLLS